MTTTLSEELIQDSFHSYLKSSLTQAKAERLLDADILSSAEADLMITGPALCLYFAALRSTTNPPSVPLPRSSKSSQPLELSYDNCPPAFVPFLRVWANTVPSIQALPPEHQHDLARIICALSPLSTPTPPAISGIAADLRAVAIEISQRRSFQDRFASDLQAALDSGAAPGSPSAKKASFVPPPLYDPSPRSSLDLTSIPPLPNPHRLSSASLSSSPPSSSRHSRTPTPTFLPPTSPAIEFIRETLYAALADALEAHPSLRTLLAHDPPRAYFAALAAALLAVATTALTPAGAVLGVLGQPLTLAECPPELRPFMRELAALGAQARELSEADDDAALRCAAQGEPGPAVPVMERVRMLLEGGVGAERGEGRRSVEGRAVAFANRVNALGLGISRLRAFRERQEDVFKVLAGVGNT